MTNINDLHIDDEILPLFDSTVNPFSNTAIRDMMEQPLGSIDAILSRQHLLQGFIGNHHIFKDYSFYRYNLAEIHEFFETFFVGNLSGRKLKWKLTFSEKERSKKKGRLILMIRLFHQLQSSYLNKIDRKLFPKEYVSELEKLDSFFSSFNLDYYEKAFEKNKFKIQHVVELIQIVAEKVVSGDAAYFWNRWYQFEAYISVSEAIIRHGFVFPVFEENNFSILDIYHPFLKDPVKNDIRAERNVILLTGPNMSGKSTLLKAVSISVYLAHAGFAVPASKATMPFFNTISVAINLTDSLVSGYSHFMSEIMTLKNVLEKAKGNAKCFAVFDELFRGTNIEDALEISTATIKGLTNFPHSLFFISTHLHQLKELKEVKTGAVSTWYIDCELKGNIPGFTYKLKEGWSDLKLGRILFEREGLNNMLV